jgi:hypothetical protein
VGIKYIYSHTLHNIKEPKNLPKKEIKDEGFYFILPELGNAGNIRDQ